MAVQDLTRIEDKIDKVVAGGIVIDRSLGGIRITSMAEVLEYSKLMATSKQAVPVHCRAEVGICFAIANQAMEWDMSPFAVANKSYVVNDRVAYEAQLIHAVIERRANLKQRLRFRYEGTGKTLKCFCTGHFKNELEPVEYESPTWEEIKVKNSPLWTSDPKQQFSFYSARAWARRYAPDVLLGIFSEDELRDSEIGPDNARDITPKPDIAKRLTGGKKKRGFDAEHVTREADGAALTDDEKAARATALQQAKEAEEKLGRSDEQSPTREATALGTQTQAASQAVTEPKSTAEIVVVTSSEPETKPAEMAAAVTVEPVGGGPAVESPLQRGKRLLGKIKTAAEVSDLYSTISDELAGDESALKEWGAACNGWKAP